MKAEEAPSAAVRIACRAIAAADERAPSRRSCPRVSPIARGPIGTRRWRGCAIVARPEGCPRYGFCLTVDDVIVGVILLIHSAPERDGGQIRCCVSSWYVEPRYRLYASALVKVAFRRKDCTYLNMSSEAHTREALIAQGYSCYAKGQFLAVPALGRNLPGTIVRRVTRRPEGADTGTGRLLLDHADAHCIALTATVGGRVHPFVFLKRTLPRPPVALRPVDLLRDGRGLRPDARPHRAHPVAAGDPLVMLDANGPVEGLPGRYFEGRMPKYYIGASPPRLGDLAYSEAALFGP